MRVRGLVWGLGAALVGCAPGAGGSSQYPAKLLGSTADGRVEIVGRVVDAAGREVVGEVVSLTCLCLEGRLERSSGADGSYRFTGLPGGRYTIGVARAGIATRWEASGGAWYRVNLRVDR